MAEYIDRKKAVEWFMAFVHLGEDSIPAETVIGDLKYAIPAANVAEMPEGKPGDYVEWDNGTGFRRYIAIDSVVFCWDCVRYQLDELCPVVDHPNIVRIVKSAEMQRMIKEKWEKEGAENA